MDAVGVLLRERPDLVLIEIGPGETLASLVRQHPSCPARERGHLHAAAPWGGRRRLDARSPSPRRCVGSGRRRGLARPSTAGAGAGSRSRRTHSPASVTGSRVAAGRTRPPPRSPQRSRTRSTSRSPAASVRRGHVRGSLGRSRRERIAGQLTVDPRRSERAGCGRAGRRRVLHGPRLRLAVPDPGQLPVPQAVRGPRHAPAAPRRAPTIDALAGRIDAVLGAPDGVRHRRGPRALTRRIDGRRPSRSGVW